MNFAVSIFPCGNPGIRYAFFKLLFLNDDTLYHDGLHKIFDENESYSHLLKEREFTFLIFFY